jgi:hypothetical protein
METTASSKAGPKDFFLFAGAMIALYGSVVSFITLSFEYINRAFPDKLAGYADPYAGSVRFAMAALIVFAPLTLTLFRLIRSSIAADPERAGTWVRRWALVFTLFIAGLTIAIDLITLINAFLGGELTTRFLLKAAIVLLVAGAIFLHFLADLKGYWIQEVRKANMIGVAAGALALFAVVAGFLVIGTPGEMRMARYDAQKVGDLQTIQWQVVNYWQQKQELPATLSDLADPLSGMTIPVDPETAAPYRYEVTGANSFTLCATFNVESQDLSGQGSYPARDISMSYGFVGEMDQNWWHGAGETCFTRTIDPERYPPFPKTL